MQGRSQDIQLVNTIVESPLTIEIPTTDLASYVFSAGSAKSRGTPVYFNAEFPSQNFSLAEAELYVKRIAKGLQNLGLKPGARVLLYSGNKLFFPIVLWSVPAAGCVFTGSSPSASSTELEYQLRDSGASLLLTSREGIDVALEAAERASLPLGQVFVFGDSGEDLLVAGAQPWTDFWAPEIEVRSWSWERLTTFEQASTTTAVINYSSGTTGLPKGVEITHYNLIANSEQVLFKRNRVADTIIGRKRAANIETSGERWLAPLPMYHAYGQTYSCLSAARGGAKVFIMPHFTLEKYLQFLDIYRITFMTTVPTILTMLNKYEFPERFNLKAVEVVTSGSAPLDGNLAAAATQKFMRAGVKVKQGWGMSETTCSVTGFSPDDEDDGRSIGWLNPNCAAKIVPVEGDEGAPALSESSNETTGEIWVAGPQMMKGYWRNEDATRGAVVESGGFRWIKTGDVGYIDGRGCIYIVDRIKELIKVKGLQVAPAELQLALVAHPEIEDAAVLGAKIDGQEHPRAFVVRKSNELKEAEVFDFIKERFAPHKRLTGGIYFIEAIPRTPSGKVKKRELPSVNAKGPWKL